MSLNHTNLPSIFKPLDISDFHAGAYSYNAACRISKSHELKAATKAATDLFGATVAKRIATKQVLTSIPGVVPLEGGSNGENLDIKSTVLQLRSRPDGSDVAAS